MPAPDSDRIGTDEIERLRTALMPFARLAETYLPEIPDSHVVDLHGRLNERGHWSEAEVTLGDLRAALVALNGTAARLRQGGA